MEEKELNFDEEMMPCEEEFEKAVNENTTENWKDYIKKITSKIHKLKTDKVSKEHKDENDDENNERANMFEEWYRKEKDKRYKINFLISDYYTKHIQELEKSIVEKDELINKIYEISNKY